MDHRELAVAITSADSDAVLLSQTFTILKKSGFVSKTSNMLKG